jgi:hypothetical protein
MNDQLATITAELDAASRRLHRLTDDLAEWLWATRPSQDGWSAAQCVEHLNLTSRAFIPRLRQAVAGAAVRTAAGSRYRRDVVGWIIAIASGPLMRIGSWRIGRVRTTAPFRPAEAPALGPTLAEFDRLQVELGQVVRSADNLAIDTVKIVSPFDARVSYSVYSALTIIAGHQMRHLEQAEDSARAVLAGKRPAR